MNRQSQSRLVGWGYGIAVAGVPVSFAVALWLAWGFDSHPGIVLLLPAVALAALVGGRGPAIVGTLLALAAAVVIVVDLGLAPLQAVIQISALAALGLGGAWAAAAVDRSRADATHQANELTAERAFLQSVLGTVPDAIMVIDEKGTLQSFSPASERLFGYTAAEVVGHNVKMLMPSPHYDNHDGYLARYRATGERHIIGIGRVVAGRRKDGSTFPLELAVGEINGPTGRYFTGFIRDLTERQAADARLQELQAELTHISRLSAMGEMASTLAHELNQPLSAISNYLRGSRRLLDAGNADPTLVNSALDKAAEQALRAGEIIRRLRDFVSRGEEQRSVEPVTKLVEEASALALVGAKELRIQASFDLDPAVPTVLVDRVQIQQVLVNLMRNAVEAMASSDRRLLRVVSRPAPGDMVEVSVSDTGRGIDPNIVDRLFQPFQTTKAQGMGVGLSICRSIVEAHGGRIVAEANDGGGAVFRFTVPSAVVRETPR